MSEQAAPAPAAKSGTPGGEEFPSSEFNMRVKKPKPRRRHRRKRKVKS